MSRTIGTERLRLRPAHELDLPGLIEALNDWSVAQWLVRPPYPYTEADGRDFIEWTNGQDESGLDAKYVIADRRSDALLGVVSVASSGEWGELGYWISPSASGFGYMAEAVAALLAHVRRTHPDLRLYATVDPENARSRKVLLGAGFVEAANYEMQTRRKRGTTQVIRFELP